jgi:Holliday junction resolvasome RuvABC ATP-dependent DNA helicase subunit
VLEHLEHRAEIDGAEPDAALKRLFDERAEDKSALDPEKVYREWRVRSSVEKKCPVYQEEVERYYENACSEESSALEKLDELIGLDQVKRTIKEVLMSYRVQREAAAAGLPSQQPTLHLAFEGSPGTGKTEVARLYGEILKEEGMLKEGRVVTVSGSIDNDILESAIGSVLFIDEAYNLTG